jgi:hypothetical protein
MAIQEAREIPVNLVTRLNLALQVHTFAKNAPLERKVNQEHRVFKDRLEARDKEEHLERLANEHHPAHPDLLDNPARTGTPARMDDPELLANPV